MQYKVVISGIDKNDKFLSIDVLSSKSIEIAAAAVVLIGKVCNLHTVIEVEQYKEPTEEVLEWVEDNFGDHIGSLLQVSCLRNPDIDGKLH